MALRGNRPGFFCGVGRWGCGFPADEKVFSFCGAVVTGQGSRRKLPGFFCGVGSGGWVPGGCEGFSSLRRRCNGTRLPAQIAGFFAGLVAGGGFPADAGTFHPCCVLRGGTGGGTLRLCGAVVTGQGSRRKLPGFFAGLAGGGTKLLQGAGLRRKGADDCGFNARRRGWRFCGGRRAGHFYDSITKAVVALLFWGYGVIIT